jgi:3-hydroxyacyl-[acyl-carrier-protein] dehydratase
MKFRLVDRILDWSAWQSIRGVKSVSFEEYQLKAAFGDPPHLPPTLMMESLLQLGNWLVVLSSDFTQMAMVVRIETVRFHDVVRPGESLMLEAEVLSRRDDGVIFGGRATSAGRPIGEGRGCLAVPVPLGDFCNPGDLRVLAGELTDPQHAGPPAGREPTR